MAAALARELRPDCRLRRSDTHVGGCDLATFDAGGRPGALHGCGFSAPGAPGTQPGDPPGSLGSLRAFGGSTAGVAAGRKRVYLPEPALRTGTGEIAVIHHSARRPPPRSPAPRAAAAARRAGD